MNHNELLAEAYAIERGERRTSRMEWVFLVAMGLLLGWLGSMGA